MPTPIETNTTTIRTIIDQVNSLPNQIVLPTLENPAGTKQILSGYEAIESDGSAIIGSLGLTDLLPALTNPATQQNIQEGYEAIGPDGNMITGTGGMGSQVFTITDEAGLGLPASAEAGEMVKAYAYPGLPITITDTLGRIIPYRTENDDRGNDYIFFIMPALDVTIPDPDESPLI